MHHKSSRFKFCVIAMSVSAALTSSPNNAWATPEAWALRNKAVVEFTDLKTKDIALKHLEQAISLEPHNPLFLQDKAGFLQANQESEEALPFINQSLEIDSKPDFPYVLKAQILNCLHRFDEALIAINSAVKRNPRPDYKLIRAKILIKQGNLDLAEKELDKLVEADCNNRLAQSALAVVALKLKHWPKEIAALSYLIKTSEKKNLSYYEDLMSRSEAYRETKQYEKAIADCKTGLKDRPEDRQFHSALLKLYELSGNASEAKRTRKKLESIDADFQPPKSDRF